MEFLQTISLALGAAWTSGINLYATVAIIGLFQKLGIAKLPLGMEVLDNWWVIGIAGGLFIIEFCSDKIPYVDAVWDTVHTFIRVPAGAILAYAAVSEFDPAIEVAALLLGGGTALTSQGTLLTARYAANLSPEPVSNWIVSVVKDILAIGGAILAVILPILLGIFVVLFVIAFCLLAPRIYRGVCRIFRAVAGFFRGSTLEREFRNV